MAGEEASSDLDTFFEPDTSFELEESLEYVAYPEGVPIRISFSSNWEAVTTTGSTFVGVYLVVCADRVGMIVPGCTYRGSRSSS